MDDFLKKALDLLEEVEKVYSPKKTFRTDIDLSYTYYPDSERYRNDLNNKIKYIMEADYLDKADYTALSYFFDRNVGQHIEQSLYFIELIKKLANDTIQSNIEFIKKEVTFLNKNINEDIENSLKNLSKYEVLILKDENLLKLLEILKEHEDFKHKILNELDDEVSLDELKSFILKNYKSSFKDYDKGIKDKFINNLIKINNNVIEDIHKLYELLLDNKIFMAGMANTHYSFEKYGIGCSMTDFFKDYIHNPDIYNCRGIVVFEDKSLLVEKELNNFEALSTKKQRLDFKNDICSKFLRSKYKKNPHLCKDFIDIIKMNNDYNLDSTFQIFEKYFNNIDIFKNYEFNLKEKIMKSNHISLFKKIEDAEDEITTILMENEVNKIIKNITSLKNIDLFDKSARSLIKEVINQKIKVEILQDYIGKKMGRFNNSEELNESLKLFLNSFGYSYDGILKKAENYNTKIMYEKDNVIILEIDNYEQSSYLGSASWCISSYPHYFESYVDKEAGNKQFFIYDFNKESTDPRSLIGITLSKDSRYITSHEKNDESISQTDEQLITLIKQINVLTKADLNVSKMKVNNL